MALSFNEPLDQAEKQLLESLLKASSIVDSPNGRQSFFNQIGRKPDDYSIDIYSSTVEEFTSIFVNKVNKAGDREALKSIVNLLEEKLPGRQAEVSQLQEKLFQNSGKVDKGLLVTNGKVQARTILVLAANPSDAVKLKLQDEIREIAAGLQLSGNRDGFLLETRSAVRIDDLRLALLKLHPQVVHFCGHGAGLNGIAVVNDDGETQLVPTRALADLFQLCQADVECVILNACYSEVQAKAISQNISYVVGMRQEIGDEAAIDYSKGFYQALGSGKSFEDAHLWGCNAIDLDNISESLTPVIKKK